MFCLVCTGYYMDVEMGVFLHMHLIMQLNGFILLYVNFISLKLIY